MFITVWSMTSEALGLVNYLNRLYLNLTMKAVRCFASSLTTSSKRPQRAFIEPRTQKQRTYVEKLLDNRVDVVIASGVAGSGKTLFATWVGMKLMNEGKVKKIILTRPAVSAEESHGYLPGSLDKKMEPWMRPLFDVLETGYKQDDIQKMLANRMIEICPIAFMRGRNFDESWIICDESQNCTPNQMLMIMTRLGMGSKLVVTGDPAQHDRGYENNGLTDLMYRIHSSTTKDDRIAVVELDEADVQRHPLIPHILNLYNN